jgi:ABC-2 type transport system ATP-binding protein
VIEARELTKRYGAGTAVDRLSFTVRPGRVTGFLGPNGAGKSTTMRMMLGLDRPSSGTVRIDGRDYASFKRPMFEVGALLDATAVPGGRNARNHLAGLARSNGIGRRRADAVLEQVGLDSVARRRIGTYSLGMKQRLGIAATLLGDPAVLMFDEPVNGLDPQGVRWIRTLFKRLAAEGRTVLVSSHLMSEMALTADDLIVIGHGRLIAQTTVDGFTAQAGASHVVVRAERSGELARLLAAPEVSVTSADDGSLRVSGLPAERIGAVSLQNGIPLQELHTVGASLEEAFMELTETSVDYRPPEPAEGGGDHSDSNNSSTAGTTTTKEGV